MADQSRTPPCVIGPVPACDGPMPPHRLLRHHRCAWSSAGSPGIRTAHPRRGSAAQGRAGCLSGTGADPPTGPRFRGDAHHTYRRPATGLDRRRLRCGTARHHRLRPWTELRPGGRGRRTDPALEFWRNRGRRGTHQEDQRRAVRTRRIRPAPQDDPAPGTLRDRSPRSVPEPQRAPTGAARAGSATRSRAVRSGPILAISAARERGHLKTQGSASEAESVIPHDPLADLMKAGLCCTGAS